jgi:hypothetical protein
MFMTVALLSVNNRLLMLDIYLKSIVYKMRIALSVPICIKHGVLPKLS